MTVMHTSTVALERKPSPRGARGRPWILSAASAAFGALLLMLQPAMGIPGYRWAAFVTVVALSVRLAWVDERTFRLPNRLVGALSAFGGMQLVGAALCSDEMGVALGAIGATVIVGAIYLTLGFAGAVGFGDVKFVAALTLVVGSVAGLFAVYVVPLAFAVSAVRIIARKTRGADPRHPHGTSLAVAGISVLLLAVSS